MNGWRVACTACGAEYLLPDPFARAAVRVRCPLCRAVFRVADPRHARLLREAVQAWAQSQPGGIEAVRAARAAGTFWQSHGAALSAAMDPHGDDGADEAAAALEAALAGVLGPGPRLL